MHAKKLMPLNFWSMQRKDDGWITPKLTEVLRLFACKLINWTEILLSIQSTNFGRNSNYSIIG
ncbi:hypothetical protein ASG85_05520 [Paenibacillus sp. Soil724D2]|nr:hypothetical protein ASG85_05520 [Paenibacillus sp. Soil724D2]